MIAAVLVFATLVSQIETVRSTPPVCSCETPSVTKPKDALQSFNGLVGSWRGNGVPESGTKEEKLANAWNEKIAWSWKFKGDDAWLELTFEKSKNFTKGELRFTPDKDAKEPVPHRFTLVLTLTDKSTATFVGTFTDKDNKVLALTRTGGPAGEEQRMVFNLLHHNRHLYRLETRPAGTTVAFSKLYQVGATKEGVAFADVPKGPVCIVSGGLGTIKVPYKGKDYWVCCSGCRDEFKDDPEKYIKEAEKKAKEKK
ncbi:MAG: YHS domain-containing protein [Planctomycetia bacterium]|nr:YHS domain-containing protein [Planctomycetia bacterium]